jgi:hypothetical protein
VYDNVFLFKNGIGCAETLDRSSLYDKSLAFRTGYFGGLRSPLLVVPKRAGKTSGHSRGNPALGSRVASQAWPGTVDRRRPGRDPVVGHRGRRIALGDPLWP